ncbi:UNVERIFIED_ORG: hypothetical protein GGR78_001126 [Xanthomonas campestris]
MVAGLARGASEVCGRRPGATRLHAPGDQSLLPPGEGGAQRRMRVRSEASCHGWKQHAGAAGVSACLPPSVISHMRVGFAPVPSPEPQLRAPDRACGAGAPRHARPWRTSCASSPRRERGFGQLRHDRVQHFSKSRQLEVAATTCRGGSVAGDWRRAAHGCAATASQTGCLPSRRADPRPRCRFYRSQYRQAVCFAVRSPQLPLCAPARLASAGAPSHAAVARKLRLGATLEGGQLALRLFQPRKGF